MSAFNGKYDIIVEASNADFTAHTYSMVYAGAAATPTINGTTVTMAAGSTIEMRIKSISGTANVYVIGNKADNWNGSTQLGSSW